jgi:hypothetical protein
MRDSNLFVRAWHSAATALNCCTPLPQVRFGAPIATRLKLLSMLLWTGCALGCPAVIVFGAHSVAIAVLEAFMFAVTGYAMFYISRSLKMISLPLSFALIVAPAGLVAAWLLAEVAPVGSVLLVAITCGAMVNLMRRSMETNPAMRELLLRASR